MQFDAAGASELEEALPLVVGHPPGKPLSIAVDGAQSLSTLRTYVAYVGVPLTFTVPAVVGAATYGWTLEHAQQRTRQRLVTLGPTLQWAPPKSGHFTVMVQACNANGCGLPALGTDVGFWIHAWPSPPSF